LAITFHLSTLAFPPTTTPSRLPWYSRHLNTFYCFCLISKLIEARTAIRLNQSLGVAGASVQACLAAVPWIVDLYQRFGVDDGSVPPRRDVEKEG
ncbi:hypothetical protein HK104_008162, partial [Borealophlyctis nickersoniae]